MTSEINLSEAAQCFLTDLPEESRGNSQHEIYRFVRWYGWEKNFTGLSPAKVASYSEQLSESDAGYLDKLELIRAFLAYSRKQGWCSTNLATHLKARKTKSRKVSPLHGRRQQTKMTQQGYDGLKAELVALQEKRLQLIEDIRRAAADKDFRENAPLDAAKEQRGQIEGRIMKIEEILGSAVILDETRTVTHMAGIGDEVELQDMSSGEKLRYVLVSPTEVDAANGRISIVSPIGKAIVGRVRGDTIEVTVPAGKLRYEIVKIGG